VLLVCLLIAGCRLGDGIRRGEIEQHRPDSTEISAIDPSFGFESERSDRSDRRSGDSGFSPDTLNAPRARTPLVQLAGIEPAPSYATQSYATQSYATQAPSDTGTGSAATLDTEDGRSIGFRDDLSRIWPRLRDDARGIVNWNNAALLGGALGAALALRSDVDGDVRRDTARHPARWGNGTEFLENFGDPKYQIPVLAGLYAVSLKRQDPKLHSLSGSLLSAYTISGVSTVAIKAIANTKRPSDRYNNGNYGFPSFHTSSAFSMAAVLDEYYGPRAGLPAYALAGLVGWSRIDQRAHDLSDVLFGAALGFVIGKSVAGRQLYGDSRVRLRPYIHPTEPANGLMLDVAY